MTALSLGEGAYFRIKNAFGAIIKQWRSSSTERDYIVTHGDQVIVEYFTGLGIGNTFLLEYIQGNLNVHLMKV